MIVLEPPQPFPEWGRFMPMAVKGFGGGFNALDGIASVADSFAGPISPIANKPAVSSASSQTDVSTSG